MENVSSTTSQPAKINRPTFLTVLCILTFIGSAFGIINNISGYMNADMASSIVNEAMDEAKKELKNEDKDSRIAEKVLSGVSSVMEPARMRKNALFMILANVLTLAGGFLMFQLKKSGFWVYVAGTILAVISPIFVFGGANLLSLGFSFFIGIFGILFVVLYSLNLKYMR